MVAPTHTHIHSVCVLHAIRYKRVVSGFFFSSFHQLRSHLREHKLLLTHPHSSTYTRTPAPMLSCPEDIRQNEVVRQLVADIQEIRYSKMRMGLNLIKVRCVHEQVYALNLSRMWHSCVYLSDN